ncbi:DNA/RNA non-specific endonuclease [Aequorivita echinoideorum]|uniref:Endonuclease n=1 Tax=Aequorivita echinoideorum TaxID=1549647 RepID=A0ABS5S4J8_9FLAO|nr:DNA/RNA non-specific endonuclease [Aequorivita echinoideorum]MBT0607319.1 DNA/RNA non-specific endonuclease [Aequorivita echinoideorum]
MNRKFIYPLVIILVTVAFYYTEDFLDENNSEEVRSEISVLSKNTSAEIENFYLPAATGEIIKHKFYTLSYSEENEQASWVAYKLTKSHLSKNNFKRPYFNEDKLVKTKSADWRNYKNSGYDRGHLCPAGDRIFSLEAYTETFLTSNISPQDREFNAGIWNRLEQKVRSWTKKYDSVYIFTGGVLRKNLKTIGSEKVTVPEEFFKIILHVSDSGYKTISFVIPNKKSSESFYKYAVSIDEIEAKTGIDFFPKLPDSIENVLENTIELKSWRKK